MATEESSPWIPLLYLGFVVGVGLIFALKVLDEPPPEQSQAPATIDPALPPPGEQSRPPRGEQNLPPRLQAPRPDDPPVETRPVRCDLPAPDDGAPLSVTWRTMVLQDPPLDPTDLQERLRARRTQATWDGRTWWVALPRQADLLLVLDGDQIRNSVQIMWTERGASCLVIEDELRTVEVAGRVAGIAEGDRVEVFLCGEWVDVDGQGHFSTHAPSSELCLAYASRQDGLLGALGTIVELDLSEGGQLLDLELDLPDYEMAGVGLALMTAEGGVEIMEPIPGGPADGAGLAPGDLVTHVDGEAIDGWDLADAVQAITGPVGSSVELTVEDEEGQVRTVRIERAPIEPVDEEEQ